MQEVPATLEIHRGAVAEVRGEVVSTGWSVIAGAAQGTGVAQQQP
jgi:hypothetical protein